MQVCVCILYTWSSLDNIPKLSSRGFALIRSKWLSSAARTYMRHLRFSSSPAKWEEIQFQGSVSFSFLSWIHLCELFQTLTGFLWDHTQNCHFEAILQQKWKTNWTQESCLLKCSSSTTVTYYLLSFQAWYEQTTTKAFVRSQLNSWKVDLYKERESFKELMYCNWHRNHSELWIWRQ